MKNTKKGFTLVELLVVIAILAILASVAVVGYSSFLKKADESNAKTELNQIVTYVNAELMDDGKWEFVAETKTYSVVEGENGALTITVTTPAAEGQENPTVETKTMADVIKACPDFADLFADGRAKIEADDKELTYTYGDGKATATLD